MQGRAQCCGSQGRLAPRFAWQVRGCGNGLGRKPVSSFLLPNTPSAAASDQVESLQFYITGHHPWDILITKQPGTQRLRASSRVPLYSVSCRLQIHKMVDSAVSQKFAPPPSTSIVNHKSLSPQHPLQLPITSTQDCHFSDNHQSHPTVLWLDPLSLRISISLWFLSICSNSCRAPGVPVHSSYKVGQGMSLQPVPGQEVRDGKGS